MSDPKAAVGLSTDEGAGTWPARGQWLAVFAFWTLLGLIESAKAKLGARVPTTWPRALIGNMPWWWVWGLLTPLVFLLARRFRIDGARAPLAVLLHLAASAAFIVLHLGTVGLLYYQTHARFAPTPVSLERMLANWIGSFGMLDLLTYWTILGVYYAFDYHARFRTSQLEGARLAARAAQAEAHMIEARLNALRMELNPHFLFNTLNAISGLVRRHEMDGAVNMLARLGELLRVTLERNTSREIPLERELSYLRLYLEIERIRFHDRLSFHLDVEPEVLDALVPPLILQPLVENAVRHGVARVRGAGSVSVQGRRMAGNLVLEVSDSGAGFSNGGRTPAREGVGLSNTRARLDQLYGDRARLALGNGPGGGARVTLTLPFTEHTTLLEVAK